MRHHEIDVGKGRLRIGGIAELHLWEAFSHRDGAGVADSLLTLVMVVAYRRISRRGKRDIFSSNIITIPGYKYCRRRQW